MGSIPVFEVQLLDGEDAKAEDQATTVQQVESRKDTGKHGGVKADATEHAPPQARFGFLSALWGRVRAAAGASSFWTRGKKRSADAALDSGSLKTSK